MEQAQMVEGLELVEVEATVSIKQGLYPMMEDLTMVEVEVVVDDQEGGDSFPFQK